MSLLPDVTLSEDMLALRGSEGPVRLYSYRGGLLALQEAYRLIACHYRRSRVQWDAKAHSCHSSRFEIPHAAKIVIGSRKIDNTWTKKSASLEIKPICQEGKARWDGDCLQSDIFPPRSAGGHRTMLRAIDSEVGIVNQTTSPLRVQNHTC